MLPRWPARAHVPLQVSPPAAHFSLTLLKPFRVSPCPRPPAAASFMTFSHVTPSPRCVRSFIKHFIISRWTKWEWRPSSSCVRAAACFNCPATANQRFFAAGSYRRSLQIFKTVLKLIQKRSLNVWKRSFWNGVNIAAPVYMPVPLRGGAWWGGDDALLRDVANGKLLRECV